MRSLSSSAGNAAVQHVISSAPVQRKQNKTGLPGNLKSGIESLSGMDMGDVGVHYNSPAPAQVGAQAYSQGNALNAPGQEQHLPHEAWHVVQQAQGRVAPASALGGVAGNDAVGLEAEADVLGARALQRLDATGEDVPTLFNVPDVELPPPGGGKKNETPAAEPDPATVAALTAGNGEVLEATMEAEPESEPALSASTSDSDSVAVDSEPVEFAEDLLDGAEEVASALPSSEIPKAVAAASALGPDAPSIIAQAAETPQESGPEAAPSGPSSTPVPCSVRAFADELGVPAPSGDFNFDIDMSDALPSTASILASPFVAAGEGIASGARAIGSGIYDAGAWVGNKASAAASAGKEAFTADPLGTTSLAGSLGGGLVSGGTTAAMKATEGVDLAAQGVQSIGWGGAGGVDTSWTKATTTNEALGYGAGIGGVVMAGAGTVAAGASIATGSIDVLRGTIGTGVAESRRRELNAIAGKTSNEDVRGQANYAASNQANKRKDRLITAGKGALGVAGGAVLITAGLTNPIGLGLLAGAALIGGGVALYQWWQGRKKVKDATGKETQVSVKEQEQMDRHNRANVLHAKRNENEYKQILLGIGISPKKLAADKVTVGDIEKALAPL